METIDRGRVNKVYIGKTGCCYCGCKGEYYYPGTMAADAMVAEVLRVIASKKKTEKLPGLDNEEIIVATIGKRDYTVYLKAA